MLKDNRNLRPDDEVIFLNTRTNNPDTTIYKVVEVIEDSVKVVHPTVAGYFVFSISKIYEVL